MSLELRIYAPHVVWRLLIEAATVQWVSEQTFGLAFFRITETERQRLSQILTEGYQRVEGYAIKPQARQ
jgi:hypothetical protein